jgi:hypothetical protein
MMPRALLPARTPRRRRSGLLQLRLELLENRWLPSVSGLASYVQPLSFEPNVGQAGGADFIAHGAGYALVLANGNLSLGLKSAAAPSSTGVSELLQWHLTGANPAASAQAVDKLAAVSNYLIGNDRSQWHTNVPTYGKVQYPGVYPGIDLAYYGNQGELEYDFIVNPGAHSGAIRLGVQGAESLTLDAAGDLLLHTGGGDVLQKAPVAYQEVAGARRAVAARFVLQDNRTVGLAVGAYDASLPLVIDPVVQYSTYLGGAGTDVGTAIAMDSAGNAYVTGYTNSTNFPTAAAFQAANAGNDDAFVAKFNAAGALVYSTYLGGAGIDHGNAIAVDSAGSAYVTGYTASTNFPTANPFQAAYGGGAADAFVTKLNPAGNGLVYSTYLGGADVDVGNGIAVDSAGSAYITGQTGSTDFPTANPFQAAFGGGIRDSFVTKLNPAGHGLTYSTYLGGAGNDFGQGIAVDSAGSAYVTGYTNSTNFPTANPFQAAYGGGSDNAFVTKLNAAGNGLAYSTYLGGAGSDGGYAIAVDPAGSAYVAGFTASTNFPTANPIQAAYGGGSDDAFVTKLNSAGNGLVYSTYLGGAGDDYGTGIAVDSAGGVYVVGVTGSNNFPTVRPLQASFGGGLYDAFVARLNPAGDGLTYSTYLGGADDDLGQGIAVDSAGSAYVTGQTASTDLPTANPFQAANGGGADVFVTKILSHFWQGQDVAVEIGGRTDLLWDAFNGQSVLWSVDNSFHSNSGPMFGPFSGWTAAANAAGGDGLSRILWTNNDGRAALWLEDSSGMLAGAHIFGPFAGWSARDVDVGSDGKTRILWTNVNGQATVWAVDNSFDVTGGPAYGPFSGWSATHLAAGGDGQSRLLWNNSNGAAAVWVLTATGGVQSTAGFGPISGWTAQDIAVGSDNQARLLWARTSGQMVIWKLSASFGISSSNVFGPFAGYTAVEIVAGSDGLTRVLWNNIDGTVALWLLDGNGTLMSAKTYGPF